MIHPRSILLVLLVALVVQLSSAAPPTTRPIPNVVTLNQLVNLYDPVPFDHKTHARMAGMWNGCQTCHHRTPLATTRPIATTHRQEDSDTLPACKSCHEISSTTASLRI